MTQVRICDITMKQATKAFSLSFKEKIELAKHLDKLGVDVVELEGVESPRIDTLRIKSIATAVEDAVIAVPISLDKSNLEITWEALKNAKKPRLQISAPVSDVQMEYLFLKKPSAMVEAISAAVAACKALCPEVEFIADDATRSNPDFLCQVLKSAISAGATAVTLCDTAGTMLPEEFAGFVAQVKEAVPEANLGICCCDTLSMANACVIAAVAHGAVEVKAAAYPVGSASVADIAKILSAKEDALQARTQIRVHQLSRSMEQIQRICQASQNKNALFSSSEQEDSEIYLTAHDDLEAVLSVARKLGYDLSLEDGQNVYEAFTAIAAKKDQVSARELDAIVASAAMQVPACYVLDTYVITAGNAVAATANLRLTRNGERLEGVCLGDGPIDAAFLAIEQITGRHYELDDFQIQSVTEGREAMGQTVVKLRSEGKVYSGRGISTDIVGASIQAYISALNKIVYEEEDV